MHGRGPGDVVSVDEQADVLLELGRQAEGSWELVGGLNEKLLEGIRGLLRPGSAHVERKAGSVEGPVGEVGLIGAEAVRFNVPVGDEPAHGVTSARNRDNTNRWGRPAEGSDFQTKNGKRRLQWV